MGTGGNVQSVKNFFAAISRGDVDGALSLVADDIEWVIPGEDWPLAGTHRGHAGLRALFRLVSEEVDTTYPHPPEFLAQGDRVFVIGTAMGTIKSTGKPFRDEWVFDVTVHAGRLMRIREYVDTQALARASEKDGPLHS